MGCLVLLLLLSVIPLSLQDESPRVVTKLGPVVGTSRVTETGKKIYSFFGIPYIKPPVEELRFKPPQPIEPWVEDLLATRDTVMCPQKVIGPFSGSENCVVLNVYTPQEPGSADNPLSVMVYIHGGGFVLGSSTPMFAGMPDYLLEHDVVLVTMNYRLGVLGFLSTEDEVAPGNYGLLDQVEALKWVKDNIAAFGGNSDDITIFGESAGSASVHMHLMSPLSKGLFHRAIAQSGTSINPWATTRRSKILAKELAKKAGCPHTSSAEMIECLQKLDARKLLGLEIIEEKEKHGMIPFVWSPRIDIESPTSFLPEHPMVLMETGRYNQVPVMIGHTGLEGGFVLTLPKIFGSLMISDLENNWDNSCKVYMSFREFLVPEEKGSEWCTAVKERYINRDKSFKESLMDYCTAVGDIWIVAPIYKATELMSRHSDVYSYVFNYDSEKMSMQHVLMPQLGGPDKIKGNVAHADDLLYLFKYPQTRWTKDSPEYRMIEIMTRIWTEFAKTGVPPLLSSNESWPRASWPEHKYVVIDKTSTIKENYERENMEFINRIYSNALYNTQRRTREEL